MNASVNTKTRHDEQEGTVGTPPSLHVPDELGPAAGEAAVLSMLTVRVGASCALASGSLLTVPVDVARMSWKRWREWQPHARAPMGHEGFLDLGPIFCAEPFAGVRAIRAIVEPERWRPLVESIGAGRIEESTCRCTVPITESTSTVLLGQDGKGAAYDVVVGARRPVLGVVATLEERELPDTDDTWELVTPTNLSPGPDLGRMWPHRHLLHWPKGLLGINWLGGSDFAPPPRFVIGRPQSRAWIARVQPDNDGDMIAISIAWDEHAVDPLACTLVFRNERDGFPLMVRQQRISDLPRQADPSKLPNDDDPEVRGLSWRERTLDVRLARGPRGADWSLMLLAPSGELLDERPMATRVERVTVALHVVDGDRSSPASVIDVGDSRPASSQAERDHAVRTTRDLEAAARRAAADRRISTAGELEAYLRWRFSCRDGELLLLDPGLFSQHREAEVVRFLTDFGRPMRVLVRGLHQAAREALAGAPEITAKTLPGGGKALHDRIWIVGETAVLVGASPGDFLSDLSGSTKAITAADFPFADAARWRERFEEWWAAGRS